MKYLKVLTESSTGSSLYLVTGEPRSVGTIPVNEDLAHGLGQNRGLQCREHNWEMGRDSV